MFFMSQDSINALKSICRICCKNVTVAEKEQVAVCLWLNEVGALTYETVVDVSTSMTNSSVPDFVKMFDFFLQQANVKALDTVTHEGNTLEKTKAILSKAVDANHSLCTAGKWHVSNKSSGHFSSVHS